MEEPNNWPPSNKIIPFLFFHINPIIESYILNKNGVEYLKKHEPIGCRDLYTKLILERKGIGLLFRLSYLTLDRKLKIKNNFKKEY